MTAVSGRCGNMIDLCLDHRLLMPSQPWQLCQDDVATGPDTATTGDRIPCNWVIIIHSCSNEPQACTFHTRVKLKKQQQQMHIKTHMNNSIHKCVITLPPPPLHPPSPPSSSLSEFIDYQAKVAMNCVMVLVAVKPGSMNESKAKNVS